MRSAAALHRLLDVLPVFEGDHRVRRLFTLAPGSDFGVDALAALESAGARTVPWERAVAESFDLIVAASPKGDLDRLDGPVVLLPHGAGFGKTVSGEGAADSASGLDPAYLLRDGRPLAALHALAHPQQITRLAERCPEAAARATVVGDPTLDRILESRTLRDRYRAALGTGARRLVVLVSTWGPESLLARRPGLAERLCGELPMDEYQLALVAHPNTHSDSGTFDLVERLPREVVLARPHEEWAALLIASDAVVSDHGSAALYAAALDRPVLGAYDGGIELLPGTPMDRLLASAPRLGPADRFDATLAAYRPGTGPAAARDAFDTGAQGDALDRLRTDIYVRLGLTRPSGAAVPRLLPLPRRPAGPPAAFGVRVERENGCLRVERRPARIDVPPPHHLAAEADAAGVRAVESAGLLYRRWREDSPDTPESWTAEALARHPGCRTAGVILSPERCLVRRRDSAGGPLTLRIEPPTGRGGAVLPDPATVLSAVHALSREELEASFGSAVNFRVGERGCRVWPAPL
ncbi:translation initiation factor 2 [Streptomyces sp. KM273126]|uniref:translation initiation factor 2 n=1 Tax=Streptomyces sp. KM273126 TaxID=2545247 RepID=UPI00104042CC|nr:translation initiation factor 2 [Streptomyces sp. KM273126]MBA2809983.1 translation initiation factor 2 [Streptomyces sp. KM273126]